MKNVKKIKALLLAALMLCSMALFSGCGGDPAYKVNVVDALGNPYTSGVVVKFMQNGTQAGMQVVNESGVAEKTLPKGDYTVELQFTDSNVEYTYDDSDMTLSASKTELTVQLAQVMNEESKKIVVQDESFEAHYVDVGCTQVELSNEERTYFLFVPTVAGLYDFSLIGSDSAIGYYGMPHYIQQTPAVEVVDNKFSISIYSSMITGDVNATSVFVLGVDASETDAVLAIERIGDPEWSIEDEPWTTYQATVTLSPYTTPAGAVVKDMDLTASTDTYPLVLDEATGYYHLNSADGPLVVVRLGEKSGGSDYLDSFETILDHSGVVKYFFDADGNFEKKEDYSQCLLKYIENMDQETGLYPLTEDLVYIIQNRGDYAGWWDSTGSTYLFLDGNGNPIPDINTEIAWMLYCSYIEQ